jgi:1,2-diacylglycerol 3-alpha-glucosyltransferase
MEKRSLRIAFATDTFYPTINGVSASTLYFAEELARLGHHVFILCPRYKGSANALRDFTKPGWSVLRCPAIPVPTNKEHSISFPRLGFGVDLSKLGIDLVHIQAPFILGGFGARLARRLGVPLTQTYHTFWEHYLHYFVLPRFLTRPIMVGQNTALCNKSAVNFVPSPQMVEGLRRYGVRTRLVVCPTGIDVPQMKRDVNQAMLRDHLGIPKDRRIVLFASRMCREKSADVALEAFALVARETADTVFVMTGDGPFTPAILRMVRKLGLRERVTVKGYLPRPDLYAHYAASDLFLFPSVSETQGLVVLEAQAFGKPVIGVAAMGVKMIMKDDVGGLLAEDLDPRKLADLCLKLLRDAELYAEKSRQAEANALEWKTSEYALLMEKEFFQVLQQPRKGA